MNAEQLQEINDLHDTYQEASRNAQYFTKISCGDEKIVIGLTIDYAGIKNLPLRNSPQVMAELHDAVAIIFARHEKRLLRKLRAMGFDPEAKEESTPSETPKKAKRRPGHGARALEV